jgi:hypothetical protein
LATFVVSFLSFGFLWVVLPALFALPLFLAPLVLSSSLLALFDVDFPAGAVAGAAAFLWVLLPASFWLLLLLAPPLLLSSYLMSIFPRVWEQVRQQVWLRVQQRVRQRVW